MIDKGKKIVVEYEGRLESGEVFDSSTNQKGESNPLTFTIGLNQVIPGFEEETQKMSKGEEKEFKIHSEKAYGSQNPELKKEIPKENFPEQQEIKKGMILGIQTPRGAFPVTVKEVKDKTVIMDFNHPLAGKNLIFKVKILDVL